MNDIAKIVKGIAGLKPVSRVVSKIMEITRDPDKGTAELADVISYDAALTANLLKSANSAFYGRPTAFDSIQQVIVFLGMDEVVDLALLSNATGNLQRPQKGYDLASGELWHYSAASALMARELAQKKNVADAHLVFTAALLKDIGKVVLEQYVAEKFEAIHRRVAQENFSFREAEKAELGIDHAELGAMVARVWNFSPKMIDVIAHHHEPNAATLSKVETAVVYLSDVLCMMMGVGGGSDGLAYRFHEDTIQGLGLNEMDLQIMLADFCRNLQHVEALVAEQ